MKQPFLFLVAGAFLLALGPSTFAAISEPVQWQRDDQSGTLTVQIAGQPAFHYRYGADVDLPHYYPILSPSGKLLTVQQTNPYPHHRSLWFADKVELAGHPPVEFYMAFTSRSNPQDPTSPFRHRIRQTEFSPDAPVVTQRTMQTRLVWEADQGKTPVLDELRWLEVVPLGQGEYLLHIYFTVTASYGDVTFRSDAVHYAWPFVRMHPQFSVDQGGKITSSTGGVNEKETHNQIARWIDYSNTVGGQTEGLAIFSHPKNEHPHRWLTRDYGTFGPRRPDAKSGKPFLLQKGQSLRQCIGILVHRGDVRSGRVAERYREYEEGGIRGTN